MRWKEVVFLLLQRRTHHHFRPSFSCRQAPSSLLLHSCISCGPHADYIQPRCSRAELRATALPAVGRSSQHQEMQLQVE